MKRNFFLILIFFCSMFMYVDAAKKSPRSAQKSPRSASLSPRAARAKMVEKFNFFKTESKKGNYHAAMTALIEFNADYHDIYSKLSAFEKLKFKRSHFTQLNGLTLNKWVTKHFTTTLDSIMKLKSICETCEHCGFLARGVQASLSVRRTQANSTSTSSMRKASEAASASSSAQATFDKAESKMQEESSPVMVNGQPLTLERATRVLITMGRERAEFEQRLAEQQATILMQEQTIENQTLKMQRMRKEFDTSKLDTTERKDKTIDVSDLSVAAISDSQKKEDVVSDLKEQSYHQSLSSSSSINNAHERRISLVPALTTPARKATKSPVRRVQRVSFGTHIEKGIFNKDAEPDTPIISTQVSIPGKSSIKQLNLQRVVEAVMAAKKAGVTINPERPLVRARTFFPPSPASAEIHMLMPPGPADVDEIPVPPQRKESSPPPPPAGTPPATPTSVAQQQMDVIPPPPDSTPPSSLIASESPSTIRRNTIAKSLHLSMFNAGVDLPPDPDAGI